MFSPKSFSPISFSFASFKSAQEDQTRSGYWRLFFYKLQEKELAQRKTASPTAPVVVKAIDVSRRKTPKRKQVKVEKQPDTEPSIPVNTKPMFSQPQVPDIVRNTVWLYSYLASIKFTFPTNRSTIATPATKRKSMSKAHLLLLLASEV